MSNSKRKPIMAICYDFDKTLSPDDMQAFTLIPSFGVNVGEFWHESDMLAKDNRMEMNLAWMYELIKYSNFKGKSLKRDYFRESGAEVKLYEGVKTWFSRINQYAESKGIEVEHYVISSGLREIIEGSAIADEFKKIYASSYLYNADGVAVWPAQAVNYTNKTQYLFRISKGFLDEHDERVNDSIPHGDRRIPFENFVYIGDSATDIPCMNLVKERGGYSIGVFDPMKDNREKVYKLAVVVGKGNRVIVAQPSARSSSVNVGASPSARSIAWTVSIRGVAVLPRKISLIVLKAIPDFSIKSQV